MRRDKYKAVFAVMLVLSDVLTTMAAFVLAYYIRREIPWPNPPQNMAPLRSYASMLIIQVVSILIVFFFYRLYHQRRAVSRVDEFYAIFGAVSIGTMMSVAILALSVQEQHLGFGLFARDDHLRLAADHCAGDGGTDGLSLAPGPCARERVGARSAPHRGHGRCGADDPAKNPVVALAGLRGGRYRGEEWQRQSSTDLRSWACPCWA